MNDITLAEIQAYFEKQMQRGLDAKAATKRVSKMLEGKIVITEDGEEVAAAEFEFAPVATEDPVEEAAEDEVEEEKMEDEEAEEEEKQDDEEDSEEKGHNTMKRKSTPIPARAKDRDEEARGGFRDVNEFNSAVMKAATGKALDPRLTKDMSTGAGDLGGFTVPPQFDGNLLEHGLNESRLAGLVDRRTLSQGNNWEGIVDPSSPWGNGGVSIGAVDEAGTIATDDAEYKRIDVKLHKRGVIAKVSHELTEDSILNIGSDLDRHVGMKIGYDMDDLIINGSGAGEPLGILNSAGLLEVAEDAGQTADTVTRSNLLNMVAGLVGMDSQGAQRSIAWVGHRTTLPELASTTLGQNGFLIQDGGGTVNPASIGPLGYNILYHQACQVLGDKGDLYLLNLSKYLMITKNSGVRRDASMHVYFDTDQWAFRYLYRIGGQPIFDEVLDDANGSGDTSPYLVLAERA